MRIIVTNPDTIFGVITKTFDNYENAMLWIETCVANHVKCLVDFQFHN